MFVLGILVALGAFAYLTGSNLAEREVAELREEVRVLTEQVARLETENAQIKGALDAARLQEAAWRQKYDQEVPKGTSRELLAAVEAELRRGVPATRLDLMIRAAGKTGQCVDDPVTRRFLVRTPIYRGRNDSVSFADNTITVTASGQSATDSGGNPQAWYDPGKPLTIEFTEIGGATTTASGLLPLHHSVVRNGYEYRFTVVPGEAQGFVHVTNERCPLP